MKYKGKLRARHFVFDRTENQIEIPRGLAGCAFKYSNEEYYQLKLNILAGRELFIVPNRTHRVGPAFWILSRHRMIKCRTARFDRVSGLGHFQVGYALRSKTEKSLILHLYDLNRTYELYLEPEDFHYNKLALVA